MQERPLFSQAIPARDSKAKIVNHIITGVKKIRVFHTSSTPTISNAAVYRATIHRIAKNWSEMGEMLRTDIANVQF